MTKEKIKFNRIFNDGWGISFDVIPTESKIMGDPGWNPTEEDRQCMLDQLVILMQQQEMVIIPIANAEVMFSGDSELIAFVRPYNFTVHFDTFQKSFICTLQNKIGGE